MFRFGGGRSNRKAYALMAATLVVVLVALAYLPDSLGIGRAANYGGFAVWILLYTRRLHDLGRSGWWQAIPQGLSIGVGVYAVLLAGGPVPVGDASGRATIDQVLAAEHANTTLATALFAASLLIQFGFAIWLGCQPGQVGDNRFGPAPGSRAARA